MEDAGIRRDLRMLVPHFLVIPLLLYQHPEYIATVPRSLGMAFAEHGVVRMLEPPVALPTFMLKQYWHPRFHHDPANRWLRRMMKKAFDQLPVPPRRR